MTPRTLLTRSLWPATPAPLIDHAVGDELRGAAATAGDRTALIFVSANAPARCWTYAELLRDAESGAHWLLDRFEAGDHLTVWSPNTPEWIVLQYAAALAGLILVTANPALQDNELEYVLRQSQSTGVAYAATFRGTDMRARVASVAPAVPQVREHIPLDGWLDRIATPRQSGASLPAVDPDGPMQLQYTSGTTGFPKGAQLSHCAMLTNAAYVHERAGSPTGTVWVSAMPLFHTAGCGLVGLGVLTRRGTHVLCEAFEPALVLGALQEYEADRYLGVPAMLRALLAHPTFDTYDFTPLRVVLSGGDSVPREVIAECERRFGAEFSTVYGQTELAPIITQTDPNDHLDEKYTTAGMPLWNVEVSIQDVITREIAPLGEVGEICARGYQAMLGYFDMPEQTRSALDADGWVHTGDLGTLDRHGYLRVTGRMKDMIIRGGENIYPREIEAVLHDHPGIDTAAVIGLPDERWGESVAAVIVPSEPGLPLNPADLQDYVRAHLAPHKAPKTWFIAAQLPSNAMGKLQKFKLRDQIASGELVALPAPDDRR
ncbi:AMP-binding protein [Nocardia africana]|uniref:Short-chain-fatty-acid--CoA ligase n=1 Tax=Nocardia africana TaxID=134964 RepID=A0A378WX65_9NOCA|nr:AMP-binding protein [Nocardia africana]MCC3313619.1 AMP-binding protein [Nocardia africana]SUA45004.1 Short-chain-fatty-acid--CoA ligase [Nocardia africana]